MRTLGAGGCGHDFYPIWWLGCTYFPHECAEAGSGYRIDAQDAWNQLARRCQRGRDLGDEYPTRFTDVLYECEG
ncbi:MAG: hypothetical protein QM706_03590 [Nitrospira sp.]